MGRCIFRENICALMSRGRPRLLFSHRKLPVFLKKDNYLWVSMWQNTLLGYARCAEKGCNAAHIGAGSGASPSWIERFRVFEADMSALWLRKNIFYVMNILQRIVRSVYGKAVMELHVRTQRGVSHLKIKWFRKFGRNLSGFLYIIKE